MDMMSLLTDFDDSKIDSRYRLVLIAAQRARQMMQGSTAQVTSKFTKEATMALDEVLQGKTEFLIGKEAKAAIKEAVAARALGARTKSKLPSPTPEETELRKDLQVYVNDKKQEAPPEPEPED